MLTIEQILAKQDRQIIEVPIPEWGDSVFVRSLTGEERIAFEVQLRDRKGSEAEKAALVMAASLSAFMCDAEGVPMATFEQAQAMAKKNGIAAERIVTAGQKLNTMSPQAVADVAKNSDPSPSEPTL